LEVLGALRCFRKKKEKQERKTRAISPRFCIAAVSIGQRQVDAEAACPRFLPPWAAAAANRSEHIHLRAPRHDLEEILDFLVQHAHASRGHILADRIGLRRAVNAESPRVLLVLEAEPPGAQDVLRITERDELSMLIRVPIRVFQAGPDDEAPGGSLVDYQTSVYVSYMCTDTFSIGTTLVYTGLFGGDWGLDLDAVSPDEIFWGGVNLRLLL